MEKPLTSKPTLSLVVAGALLIASVMAGSRIVKASDPLDGQTQCQACLDTAREDWQRCIAIVEDDEGDDHCETVYDGDVIQCQSTVCIY